MGGLKSQSQSMNNIVQKKANKQTHPEMESWVFRTGTDKVLLGFILSDLSFGKSVKEVLICLEINYSLLKKKICNQSELLK